LETARTSTAGEPLHRLDLAGVRSRQPSARSDREDACVGQRPLRRLDQAPVGPRPSSNEPASGGVLVQSLRADHELGCRDTTGSGNPDVKQSVRPLLGERARRCGGGLHRADAAGKRLRSLCPCQLRFGCRHDEDHRGER
jgi:hypothetical protein